MQSAIINTNISSYDKEKGTLLYQQHTIEQLVNFKSYEEIVFLLWHKSLPNAEQLAEFKNSLTKNYDLDLATQHFIAKLPTNLTPETALQITLLTLNHEDILDKQETSLQILAKSLIIIASYYRHSVGLPLLNPKPELDLVSNYFYLLFGKEPNDQMKNFLNTFFILIAELSVSLSTYAARVIASAQTTFVSAISSAMIAFAGKLHAGASSGVFEILKKIAAGEEISSYIDNILNAGQRVSGFGHQIYTDNDPRVKLLVEATKPFCDNKKIDYAKALKEVEQIEKQLEKRLQRKLFANIDFWAVWAYQEAGLPESLFLATVSLIRIGSWTAHIIEQTKKAGLLCPKD